MMHVHLPLTPPDVHWPLPWVWALTLLVLLPLPVWLALRPARRPALRYSSLEPLRAAGGVLRRRLRLLLPALRSAALLALIVAAARPQTPNESRRTVVEGIAIQMVLDTSWSMMDRDLSPPGRPQTRLEIVKDVFRRFVAGDEELPGRPNDLIGMIRFATYADSVCPLTLDHRTLLDLLARVEVPVNELGVPLEEARSTAIGDGLALAVERLRDLKRTTGSGDQFVIRSRIVILLTDGENNAGLITPEQAGQLAATFGIRVYTIMAGTGQMTALGRLPVDDRDLRRIAELSGGRHYVARDRAALADIYAEIDRLERTRTEEQRYVEWGELAWPWLMAAFVCLALQAVLDATLLRKIP